MSEFPKALYHREHGRMFVAVSPDHERELRDAGFGHDPTPHYAATIPGYASEAPVAEAPAPVVVPAPAPIKRGPGRPPKNALLS